MILKFVSHSERTFATALTPPRPSRGKSIHHCLTKWLPFQQSVVGVCLSLREVTALWWFSGRSDGKLDVVVLQRRHSESGMNNFAIEAASVIKGMSRRKTKRY
jgi:alpha-D-ribose 1-methylphosphonate 5-triphosphate synthase subunit PhnH